MVVGPHGGSEAADGSDVLPTRFRPRARSAAVRFAAVLLGPATVLPAGPAGPGGAVAPVAVPQAAVAPVTVAPVTGPDAAPGSAAAARDEAARVAAEVTRLTEEYRRRRDAADRSAATLATASAAANDAEQVAVAAQEDARQARALQAARVRGLAVDGGVGDTLTFLTAPSGQEALWRASTGRYIARGVLRTAAVQAARTGEAVREARESAARARAAVDAVAQARRRHDEDADAARLLLDAARARLDGLSERARRLAVTERAAARLAAQQAEQQAADRARRARVQDASTGTATTVPPGYLLLYRAAAGRCPGLRWSLLAAVGQVESGHGRHNGPSWAGAVGPMQFMPATFAAHGVDGDGDGVRDPWNPADAVPSAAAYLCAGGLDATQQGVRDALFTYNRSQAYVDLVLATEQSLLGTAGPA